MRLILIGCEYAGKTALAVALSKWLIRSRGVPFVRWHNHFVVPYLDRHLVVREDSDTRAPGKTGEEEWGPAELDEVQAMSPALLEQFQRHMIWRHLHPGMYRDAEYPVIDWYYADAVYAPLYYGYGEPGSFADRRQRARVWDTEVMHQAPDTVLVLVRAAPQIIRQRRCVNPHPRGLLREVDVQQVLDRFEEEYEASLIARRFALDTSRAALDETLEELLAQMQPYLAAASAGNAGHPVT